MHPRPYLRDFIDRKRHHTPKQENTMKAIKYLLVLAVVATTAVSCLMDKPEVEFSERRLVVPAEGGSYTLTLWSTGVDSVTVSEDNDFEDWQHEVDWITDVELIGEYTESEDTRALLSWKSAVRLTVLPNTDGTKRVAYLNARSFGATDRVKIVQKAK